jgi:hypothetical protein
VAWVKEGPQGQELISIGQIVFYRSHKYQVSVNDNSLTLAINNVGRSNGGTYRCQAAVPSNSGGNSETKVLGSFKLDVGEEENTNSQ